MTIRLLSTVATVVLASVAIAETYAAASNSSAAHATFGAITSGSGECVVGNPNTYISPTDLKWIWDNRMEEARLYNNWIMDHVVHNKGSINYCIRWDNDNTLTKEVAAKLEPMLTRQLAGWNHWLIGYNCWPYDNIKVNIVGVAVKENVPKIATVLWKDPPLPGLSRVVVRVNLFDISLWPKPGMNGVLRKSLCSWRQMPK
ncbi:hypothetical protein PHMEG_0007197 [Phytophthora megakarya]|uniref:RxLR effector protein n=1 Tax=Phytophthora megakarya TaxID=4795 RepID=A0A225WLY5_9STRA|nr:hypothetical protein PHMEG_0007197 [Phytophthora megakarya]